MRGERVISEIDVCRPMAGKRRSGDFHLSRKTDKRHETQTRSPLPSKNRLRGTAGAETRLQRLAGAQDEVVEELGWEAGLEQARVEAL